jgi:REP element-mobilizing transposase RayT
MIITDRTLKGFNVSKAQHIPMNFQKLFLSFGKQLLCMGTYKQLYYHIVFATKNREPALSHIHQEALYKYIWGIVNGKHCHLYRIGGMEDHLHIFSDLNPALSLSGFIKDIKLASSCWMKESGLFPHFTYWQEGYGAFTCSVKDRDVVIDYIRNQKEHHKKESFYDEYKRLLTEHEIPFEEKYLL